MISEKIKLVISSLPENIHKVEEFVENICDEYNINNTFFGNILVVLTEAVENSMFHGNKNNPQKNVQIIFSSKPKGLSFMVKDEGEGFDFINIPDPTDINIASDEHRGRGIFLIKTLADEIHYSDSGKSLEIIFKISSINRELSINRINQLKKYSGAIETSSIQSRNKMS